MTVPASLVDGTGQVAAFGRKPTLVFTTIIAALNMTDTFNFTSALDFSFLDALNVDQSFTFPALETFEAKIADLDVMDFGLNVTDITTLGTTCSDCMGFAASLDTVCAE